MPIVWYPEEKQPETAITFKTQINFEWNNMLDRFGKKIKSYFDKNFKSFSKIVEEEIQRREKAQNLYKKKISDLEHEYKNKGDMNLRDYEDKISAIIKEYEYSKAEENKRIKFVDTDFHYGKIYNLSIEIYEETISFDKKFGFTKTKVNLENLIHDNLAQEYRKLTNSEKFIIRIHDFEIFKNIFVDISKKYKVDYKYGYETYSKKEDNLSYLYYEFINKILNNDYLEKGYIDLSESYCGILRYTPDISKKCYEKRNELMYINIETIKKIHENIVLKN